MQANNLILSTADLVMLHNVEFSYLGITHGFEYRCNVIHIMKDIHFELFFLMLRVNRGKYCLILHERFLKKLFFYCIMTIGCQSAFYTEQGSKLTKKCSHILRQDTKIESQLLKF